MNNVVIAVRETVFCGVIAHYLHRCYGVTASVGEVTELRRRIGSVYPLSCEMATWSDGVFLTSEELRFVVRPVVRTLVCAVRALCPTQITLVGEHVAGLADLLEDELGISVIFAENSCQPPCRVIQ